MANILIIDDDRLVMNALVVQLTHLNHTSMVAETLSDGLEMLPLAPFDVVFLDVNLPDGNGLEALPTIRRAASAPEVIIMTGEGSATGAELAIRTGAWDYLQKPLSNQEIELLLTRALEYRASKLDSEQPQPVSLKRSQIIGSSPELNACLEQVAQCAASDANVLITGGTGTGKELFAKVIHENSLAAENRFVVVDCAALPEQLVESVLFGHAKGAFTGADSARAGLVKAADGGTLFLDEIGELPLTIQMKFLRVLQERCFKPVGRRTEVESHFRLICATNRDLDAMAAEGRFREDLLFRLRTFSIELPPLRTYKSDIRELVLHYIDRLCRHHGLENKGFVPELLEALTAYDWPGNVREMIHTLEKTLLTAREAPTLYPNHLPRQIRLKSIQSLVERKRAQSAGGAPPTDAWASTAASTSTTDEDHLSIPVGPLEPLPPLKQLRDQVNDQLENLYLSRLMAHAKKDLDRASEISGLSKPRIYALLKKHKISRK